MPEYWEIVGGVDKGGVIVRSGKLLSSPQESERLSTGAYVEEVQLIGDRLHYRRVKVGPSVRQGTGPEEGWVSTKLSGKALAERLAKEKAEAGLAAVPPPSPRAPVPAADVAPPPVSAAPAAAGGAEPRWIAESRAKLQAFRDGVKVPPVKRERPIRLAGGHPREMLPPFKRLDHKAMAEMSVQNLPGCWSGMKFPHSAEQLRTFGPEWYTEAFHKFGTLPQDNRVTKVVSVEQLPHSGFDAAGGAGHKAFVTVEYEKPDPELHTELFAKMPWDYFESDSGKAYRMQISTYGDLDSLEVMTNMAVEHLLPFRMPKFYFGDLNRETTNYVLITERVPFGKRGKVVNGKVVEKIEQKPFEVMPVCGKYQDYLLDDPARIYFCIFREMAHLGAWDHTGHYDEFFGPMNKFTSEMYLQYTGPRKAQKKRRLEILSRGCDTMMSSGLDFAMNVAPQIFTKAGKDPKMLEQMKKECCEMAPYFDDMRTFLSSSSDYIAAMHMNLQADNAYFWADEHGDLDAGVFDWCGFQRTPFVLNFMGCLSGAEPEVLDAHEEGLLKMFCDEYERYGGPHLEVKDLLLRYRLQWPGYVMDCCQWVERDIYRECPREEWPTVKSRMDDKFIDRWNVRCRGTSLLNAFEFWPRRPFTKIFNDWKEGEGKPFITPFTLE